MTFFNRLNFSRYVGVSNILILSLLALSGCSQSSKQAEKNRETTGVFSEEAEAFYLKRHADLVEAYSKGQFVATYDCLLYTSPSPRDRTRSRMPSSA